MDVIAPVAGRPYVMVQATGEASPLTVAPELLLALYKQHGALLLRGFGTTVATLHAFTAQFCSGSVFNESPDRLQLDPEHNIQSVNGGTLSFPLHPELSREPWKPDVCFFACIVPPRALGQTTICDGVELARQLPPALHAEFARRRLRYIQGTTPEHLLFWLGTSTPTDAQLAAPPPQCPYSFARIAGRLVRMFTRPALHRPMFTDAPAWGNFLLFSYFFNRVRGFPSFDDGRYVPDDWLETVRAVGETLTVPIAWQAGDLLMLDNSRFLHGRTAVVENDNRLIASYFGYLKDAPLNPEEPADPLWRRTDFRPPQPRRAG